MLSYEENVRAVLECNFAGMKDELIDNATRLIVELAPREDKLVGEFLDKIKASRKEMEALICDPKQCRASVWANVGVENCLEIIDELIAEVEE